MKNTIQIECVRISGFRGIQNMEINLPRIGVLIGPNNSGKTSVLKALQLALGNYAQYISEEDFFIDRKDKRADKIIIDIKIIPYKDNPIRQNFDKEWKASFKDKIKREGDQEFVAVRTITEPDEVKGGFKCQRYIMQKWPDFNSWRAENPKKEDKMHLQLPELSFIPLEPQRDIFHELRDKSSFVGKILADIKYDESSTKEIEKEIEKINQEALEKSEELKNFKNYLERLNSMFHDKSDVSISPLPKKIRDLSKHFSIFFGKKDEPDFSMEYHGSGTRSWASILTTLAFIKSRAKKHKEEGKPFFPLFAAEEPEAHLHPNAQKTLYRQIAELEGQAIITSHSPYFAATANISNLRSLSTSNNGVLAKTPANGLSPEEIKKINREIIYKRGELLFAKAWILCEGITEEQLIPAMFELRKQKPAFDFGISCVGVNGKNYSGFLKLALNMEIPVCIISDNDSSTKKNVKSQIEKLSKITGAKNFNELVNPFFLKDKNNLEADLLNNELDLKDEIIEALIKTKGIEKQKYIQAKKEEMKKLSKGGILNKMKENKASYSSFLADIIRENPNGKQPEEIIPEAVWKCFDKILELIK